MRRWPVLAGVWAWQSPELEAAGVSSDWQSQRATCRCWKLTRATCCSAGRASRVHPLLAELLRPRAEAGPVMARMTEWFLVRLPEQSGEHETDQGRLWGEIQAECAALVEGLSAVRRGPRRVERGGSWYAMQKGPFQAWMQLCERGLREIEDPEARSNFLWTLGMVAQRAGELERALEAAQQKVEVDRGRGEDRGVAMAEGLVADVLQARGQLDEALRIRQEEELPVYERLGDVR